MFAFSREFTFQNVQGTWKIEQDRQLNRWLNTDDFTRQCDAHV